MSVLSTISTWLLGLFPTPKPTTTTPTKLPQCKYLLNNSTSSILLLPDGRKLGYAQYGSPTGIPIFYLHGFPGSRLEVSSLHDIALSLNARIISLDRPGIGWSSPHPSRTLLDFPRDVERLAAHLGVERYSVLGVSGGGPYALACAYALPQRSLVSATLVCGLGPRDIGMKGAGFVHKLGYGFGFTWAPVWAIRWLFSREPMGRIDLSDEERFRWQMELAEKVENEKDLIYYNDPDRVLVNLRSAREAFAQGWGVVRDDWRVLVREFGFRVQDVREDLPVRLWYGKQDTFVPSNHGVQIAARLGARARLRVEDDTHASIWFRWQREILRGIVEEHGRV
ncbi:alpha/beta hydrolase fold protein [Sporormia fimetaria CBS 119925]|uniref:Alpha/beta hydrolase fold protein n=1 Tax=Sporormia fimetaria CBS 119925 TaxID=1340428 RepID=A0A6A6V5T8_9PLEO|nr:alpha/beta hydrolase fold protein [Sporormia fimetaria CBS 119925]